MSKITINYGSYQQRDDSDATCRLISRGEDISEEIGINHLCRPLEDYIEGHRQSREGVLEAEATRAFFFAKSEKKGVYHVGVAKVRHVSPRLGAYRGFLAVPLKWYDVAIAPNDFNYIPPWKAMYWIHEWLNPALSFKNCQECYVEYVEKEEDEMIFGVFRNMVYFSQIVGVLDPYKKIGVEYAKKLHKWDIENMEHRRVQVDPYRGIILNLNPPITVARNMEKKNIHELYEMYILFMVQFAWLKKSPIKGLVWFRQPDGKGIKGRWGRVCLDFASTWFFEKNQDFPDFPKSEFSADVIPFQLQLQKKVRDFFEEIEEEISSK